MADTSDILNKSLECSEFTNDSISKLLDKIFPSYFYMAFQLGSKFKTIEEVEKHLGHDEGFVIIKELYEKGKLVAEPQITGFSCPKCKKQLNKTDGMKFCLFCGEKLN